MTSEEVHMLLGFRSGIDKMEIKLRDLKNFLVDADRRNITDKSVQEWVAQLKRAMYEAADILDLCQLKAMEPGMSTADVGCCNPLLFCMRNPSHAHDIGTRIKALNKRLDIIKERSAAFSFIPLGSYEDRRSKVHDSHSGNRRRETSGVFDRSGVVGEKIEQDTRKLVEIMLSEKEVNTNIMVVAVVGVGGIGKTTLAQKVFNDEALNAEFEKLIWLSINKDFDKVDLLRTIITQAGGEHGREKALAVLQPILATSLKGKKLFLVLDDVWDYGAWDDVLKTPLANIVAQGSRVLVTTRDERVARRMKAVLPYHHVDKLEDEDAWSLLKKQIISSETDECEIDMLKDIGVQIVGKCDGLPLALKYISVRGCKQFVKLPGSIVKLGQLRENFPSLVELDLDENLDLERITNLPRSQLTIEDCPKLKVLEGVPALQRLMLTDKDMETLPIYMGGINPRHLELCCRLALLASIAAGQSGLEWDKFRHVGHVKAYAGEGGNSRKWYVLYTAKPYNLETNVSFSFMSRGTLSYFEDAQRFQFVFKMTRETFSYICSLVMGPSMQDMNSYTFVDGRVLSLQDRVAIALRRLHSSEPTGIVGSSVGVNESTALSVTERFIDAMWEQADHHSSWPDCNEKDEIKSKFEKIHKMNNCCGVICATQIPFGPNWEKNKTTQMQVIVDPEMRFRNIWLGSAGSINHINILYDSHLFNGCEKGGRLNGSKLKVALDGSEVGEYIIGDTGYPLLPWLLTPYQEEDLSDTKAEFNRRHSAARTCALKALARLKDTWKCLQGEVWWPANLETLSKIIYACCRLHNIVIELEDDAAMLSTKRKNYSMEVREIAKEDAVRARDMLSQHFMASTSSKSGEQDDEAASSGPRDENKEQELQTRTEDD
ncbi:hypothetical protein ZWY2020_015782 [Hordeum vulgare]|nr:hypothetical protein ZWY2020_015782 [Hordeum vulgare]